MATTNWAGNHSYPVDPLRPTSISELSELLQDANRTGVTVRALGSRHSFNSIADAEILIDLSAMSEVFEVDTSRQFVHVNAAMTYGRLAELLEPEGLAVHNMASLPHISIAGAVMTGTHGSGIALGNLATSVVGFELLDAHGEQQWNESEAMLNEGTVGLGATGIVTRLALAVEPAFEVEQRVFTDLRFDQLSASFDEIFASAYSVSAFTRYVGDTVEQVWLKRRTDEPDNSQVLADAGAVPAVQKLHPILELPAEACTEQLGVPGLWSDRLPHFKMDFTPSAGDEIQSEYFIARADAPYGIAAIRAVVDKIADALLISEIRVVAADRLAMSPCNGRDSVAFHFTWRPDQASAERASAAVLDALAPYGPRPHWGKVFPPVREVGRTLNGFDEYLDGVDPLFVNSWFRENVAQVEPWEAPAAPSPERHVRYAELGIGTFGSDHVSHGQVAAAVGQALREGCRFIDCASVYGNESHIGEVLAQLASDGTVYRNELIVSSKVWNDQHHDVRSACEQTIADLRLADLHRLYRATKSDQTLSTIDSEDPLLDDRGYLDLYLVHWPFPNHHPPHCDVDERNPAAVPYSHEQFMQTWRQMEDLVDLGLVRAIGTSNMTIAKLEPLLRDARIAPVVNQMELHPHFQQPELFDYLVSNDIQPIGFCPIGSPARPERDRTPTDTSPIEDPVIVEIAARYEVHPAIICLKWAQQRGQLPIPFSTTPRNITANLGASDLEPLTDEDMVAIAALDRGNRLIKGQVFLWPEANDWNDLWI